MFAISLVATVTAEGGSGWKATWSRNEGAEPPLGSIAHASRALTACAASAFGCDALTMAYS